MLSVDGLLLGTVGLALCALLLLHNATDLAVKPEEGSYGRA
jgi:hypothetical protein